MTPYGWLTAGNSSTNYANLTKGTWPESWTPRAENMVFLRSIYVVLSKGCREKEEKEPFEVKLCTHTVRFPAMLAIDDRHGATTSARLRRVFRSTSSHHRRSSIASIKQEASCASACAQVCPEPLPHVCWVR